MLKMNMKIKEKRITKNISAHTSPEQMFYIIPTLCTNMLDMSEFGGALGKWSWRYLIAIKWFKWSVGISFKKRK